MKDVNFNCPHCGQNLDAPDDMVGLFIECPVCEKVIKIPSHIEVAGKGRPENPFTPAPPRPAIPEEKSSTMRIDLPPDLGIPKPQQRKVIIKRTPG